MKPTDIAGLLGKTGRGFVKSMRAAQGFLDAHPTQEILERVGQTIDQVPACKTLDKQPFQKSYGGGKAGPTDDLLAGRGLFYITEQRRLYLDCTSGHYQMVWGYGHPDLCAVAAKGMKAGIVWDNHSNIPQAPVKRLAARLVELANPPGQAEPLDTVLLGICTGSVACGAALKMQLVAFEKSRGPEAVPVVVVLDGNYHGTDMITQNLRGMWPRFVRNIQVVAVQPNDNQELESAFRAHGRNVAAFWAEPVMMNREAIAVEADYLQFARRLCDQNDVPMCMDEIQTGFWRPEMFDCRALGVVPDMLICGKGMTAGFHPLAAVVYKRRYDVLEQYDAISTNGQSALPALVALANMALIEASSGAINAAAGHYRAAMTDLAARHAGVLEGIRGRGHMVGLKFRRREDALEFHKRAVANGLWVRAHAYHAGHSTVLTKLGLLADAPVVDFIVARLGRLLESL